MADTSYHHGIRNYEESAGLAVASNIATAVIALLGTADDADATVFPLNTPVLIDRPGDYVAIAGAAGSLGKALKAIALQSGTVPTIVVRVEEGDTPADTTANLIGTTTATGMKTGVQAFLTAEAKTGVMPTIFGAPYLDTKEVTTAVLAVAKSLSGFTYAAAIGNTMSEAILYAKGFGDREVLFLWPDFLAFDVNTKTTDILAAPAVAMGLRAQVDGTDGVAKVLSNVLVKGVTGISKDVFYDIMATGTDADLLNAGNVGTLINRAGFRFWGSRTPAQDTDFLFENYTRTAQLVARRVASIAIQFADKPAYKSILRDLRAAVEKELANLVAENVIIAGKAWFDPSKNNATFAKAGKFALSYDYAPYPPIEDLSLYQVFSDDYFGQLVASATANTSAS